MSTLEKRASAPKFRSLNQSGSITLDFIFALVLVFSLVVVLFSMTFTLSVVEIVQYFTYATARVYSGGHKDQATQKSLAQQKFLELRQNPAFASLFKNGFFELSDVTVDDFRSEFTSDSADDSTFIGARATLTAKALDIRVPFFGSTSETPNTFKTNLSSYLIREPTLQECLSFNQQRLDAIKRIPGANFNQSSVSHYVVVSDNGC
jgi:hypothetical protein